MAGTSTADHPVLQMQAAMNGSQLEPDGNFFSNIGDQIDNTPLFVAGLVLGGAVTLFLLKAAGFRFNFGVGANVG